MTDDNEKSTQTSSPSPKKYKPALDHDFIPPSLLERERLVRRADFESESESESETSTETETESETDEGNHPSSMVVMDAQKPIAPALAVRKKDKTPRAPKTPKFERETPRQRGISVIRNGREYVEVEDDRTTLTSEPEKVKYEPTTMAMYDKPRKKRRNTAIIEVQDAVELDAKRNDQSLEEERQVAVPAVTKESMRQIDEGQVGLSLFNTLQIYLSMYLVNF